MSAVRSWLSELGLESYWGLFEGCGYNTVDSLKRLTDYELTSIGILDANHRRAVLSKAANKADTSDDFSNMLGDLSSVIKDLESFSVPTHIDADTLPTNSTDVFMNSPATRKSVLLTNPPMPPPMDFDLDSLLDDLSSFDPTAAVTSRPTPAVKPAVQQQYQQQFEPHPPSDPAHQWSTPGQPATRGTVSSQSSSSNSTPQHARQQQQQQQPSPPSTPGTGSSHHTPVRSATQVGRNSYVKDVSPEPILRSRTEVKKRTASEASENSSVHSGQIVTVPVPDLSGVTEQLMTAEAENQRLELRAEELRNDPNLTEEERESMLKEERMRIGIEKMRMAHKRRMAIKVFNPDRSNKTVVVEEGMNASMVCHLLVVKNHFDESPNWVLVEQLGDVSLERELEDHEDVVDVCSTWPREHNNVFLFKQNEKKYDLFEDPIKYFPDNLRSSQAASQKMGTLERTEKARKILLQEYFSSTSRVPELEGFLYLKDGYKKSWKKVYCILRASGLYYSNKGKNKTAKHLVQLVQFIDYELYFGINFKKMLKAPSPYCFALRPIARSGQDPPSVKEIKVLCCEEEWIAISWPAGIRLAKYGLQLRDNFHKAKLTQFKLEDLAAPEGAKGNLENRASKLVGMRLDKHLDKVREQYKAQKEEEETKKKFFQHGDDTDGAESSEGGTESMERSSEFTPETSPAPPARNISPQEPSPHPSPLATHRIMHNPQPNGDMASPREVKGDPEVAPWSKLASTHQSSVDKSDGRVGYNPYPPPSVAAPPSPHSQDRTPVTSPTALASATAIPPPTSPQGGGGSDKEALFAYAWYHGSIPRDEALRRLESVGGFDGAYLVRDSTTVANSYVLTMYAKSTSKNFQILPSEYPNGMILYRIDDGPGFRSIDDLIRHYKQDSDRLPCRLTEFCPRPPTRMTEC